MTHRHRAYCTCILCVRERRVSRETRERRTGRDALSDAERDTLLRALRSVACDASIEEADDTSIRVALASYGNATERVDEWMRCCAILDTLPECGTNKKTYM